MRTIVVALAFIGMTARLVTSSFVAAGVESPRQLVCIDSFSSFFFFFFAATISCHASFWYDVWDIKSWIFAPISFNVFLIRPRRRDDNSWIQEMGEPASNTYSPFLVSHLWILYCLISINNHILIAFLFLLNKDWLPFVVYVSKLAKEFSGQYSPPQTFISYNSRKKFARYGTESQY